MNRPHVRAGLLALGALLSFASPAAASTGSDIASIALANVGKGACSHNSTGGSSFDSSCTGNGGQPEYWCADFARWVWAAAGVDASALDAAAGSFYVYGQRNNTLHYPPQVGDAVVFDYSGGGVADHVALVTQVNPDDSIETVSGDWGGSGGSEAAFSSTSSVVLNAPAYASGVGSYPAIMGMTISGFISPVSAPPPCTDECTESSRVGIASAPTGNGTWIVDSAGHVYPNGNAGFFGDLTGQSLAQPVVGIAAAPSGQGYWLVAADGGVFTFGAAGFYGSRGGSPLSKPVVGMAATPTGHGYWLVAADGGIFAYGDAGFHGSAGGMPLNQPVVGMAATPTGQGYWLVAADGGIFAYGDAGFHGSAGGMTLNAPVVGMAASATGQGYWLVASDGGIFSYGDAAFHGSAGSLALNAPVVGMAATSDQGGYWLEGRDGGIFTYGDASYLGNALGSSCSGNVPVQCVVASTGCTVIQNAAACEAGQACDHGTCQATCTDECTTGASRCGAAGTEVCGHYGSVPCNTWSADTACPSGQTCQAGACAATAAPQAMDDGGSPALATDDGGEPPAADDAGSAGQAPGSPGDSPGADAAGPAPGMAPSAGAQGASDAPRGSPGASAGSSGCAAAGRSTGNSPLAAGLLAGLIVLGLRRRRAVRATL